MNETRTQTERESGCAHVYTRRIGPFLKCTSCGKLTSAAVTYNASCPDCEFDLHRCGRCGQTLDHTMAHNCPKAYGT